MAIDPKINSAGAAGNSSAAEGAKAAKSDTVSDAKKPNAKPGTDSATNVRTTDPKAPIVPKDVALAHQARSILSTSLPLAAMQKILDGAMAMDPQTSAKNLPASNTALQALAPTLVAANSKSSDESSPLLDLMEADFKNPGQMQSILHGAFASLDETKA